MKKGLLKDREVKCPFFVCHGPDFIRCEGVIPDTRVRQDFVKDGPRKGQLLPDPEAKTTQYRVFCCGQWRKCEHGEAVRRAKYEDD